MGSYMDFSAMSRLEIYPIRNWYSIRSPLLYLDVKLEIYPIRNWYEFSVGIEKTTLKLEIYPIRNWYNGYGTQSDVNGWLEIYPIRNWYVVEFETGAWGIWIRNISYKELIHSPKYSECE